MKYNFDEDKKQLFCALVVIDAIVDKGVHFVSNLLTIDQQRLSSVFSRMIDKGLLTTDDDHEKYVTIFCPTAPNPTSGFIYHVPRENVYEIDESVEDTMRTVLSGGFGSNVLITKYYEKYVNQEKKEEKEQDL